MNALTKPTGCAPELTWRKKYAARRDELQRDQAGDADADLVLSPAERELVLNVRRVLAERSARD